MTITSVFCSPPPTPLFLRTPAGQCRPPCPPSLPGAALSYPQPYPPVSSPAPMLPRARRWCPSRTSSSLYIAALGPPEAIPPFPCASPSLERCFQYHPAAAHRPHAVDPLPDLPKSGQAFKRVRRGSLSLPTPFPLSSEPFPRRIGAKTELALAGHGRRTCS
jgi:hypothetical protein